MPARDYVDAIHAGHRITLARAITLVESTLPADQDLAEEVIEACLPDTGKARRLGITGVPGVGKSTFIEALGTHLTRELGETVAVLSVDPSSPVSGGSILGDKTRMEKLATDDRAFIRPSPSAGHLGGVARRTRETMLLCEAAGFQNIFIETVGVGQSETTVRSMVDTFLLLMLSGAGDELQGIKRGIMEMVDILAINKADGDNLRAAQRARAEYEMALHFFPAGEDGWTPRVLTCSSTTRDGIGALWATVHDHQATLKANGYFEERRRRQALAWFREMILDGLEDEFRRDKRVKAALPALEIDVRAGRLSSFRAARDLLNLFHRKDS